MKFYSIFQSKEKTNDDNICETNIHHFGIVNGVDRLGVCIKIIETYKDRIPPCHQKKERWLIWQSYVLIFEVCQ